MNPIRISLVLGALAIGSAAIAQSTPPAAADVPSSAQATDPAGKAPDAAAPLPPPERGMHRHGMHHGGHAHHDMHHGGHGRHGMRDGAMLRRVDVDRDGMISRAELLESQQRQLAMFERADTDRNGQLTREEMRAFRAAMRGSRQAPGGVQGTIGEPERALYHRG